jgi:transcriptional regulator with XRE-family HTH domain
MNDHVKTPCPEEITVNIGKNISVARNALEWTQSDLAMRTGLSRSTIAKIESYNVADISMSTLSSLARAFDVPTYVLMLGKSEWKRLAQIALPQIELFQRFSFIAKAASPDDIARLEKLSKSESRQDRQKAAREIDDFAARILTPVRADDTEIRDEIESSIGNARRVSSALESVGKVPSSIKLPRS